MNYSYDFLQHPNVSTAVVRPRRWLFWTVFVLLILFVFGGFLVRPIQHGRRAWGLAEQGKLELVEVERLGTALDFEAAGEVLEQAQEHFQEAQKELSALGWLQWVPWLGKQIQATDHLLTTGMETMEAVQEVLSFGAGLSGVFDEIEFARANLDLEFSEDATFATITPQEKRLILARFAADIPKLEAARAKVDRALKTFSNIPTTGLAGPLARAIEPLAAQLPRLRDDLDRVIPVAKLLPAFAGYPEPKQTLILFLNNAELRPGGGFIGTIGRLHVADATVLSLETKDAYQVDRLAEDFLDIPPPAPLEQYLGINKWFMRDANWSPDFARSAELTTHFYEREISKGVPVEQINNVIAFTPTLASEVLRITGPVLVRGHTFDAENLFELLEYQVEQAFADEGIHFDERKGILADLVDETIDRLMELPVSKLEELLAVLDQGFINKQIMLYDRDPEIQAQIEAQDWGGRIQPPAGDFLMVVDANLGSLKSDPEVKRHIDYQIEPDGDRYRATVSITYRHEGKFDWKTTRYRTYARVYVPEGSEFVGAQGTLRDDKIKNPGREPGAVTVSDDPDVPGTKYFGAFTAVEPGEERTITFTYYLAPQVTEQIKSGEYHLLAQKQLGTTAHELTLDLGFGKTVKSADMGGVREQLSDSTYRLRTDLRTDRSIAIQF